MNNSRPLPGVRRGFMNLGSGEAVARVIAFCAAVYLARQLGPGVYGGIVLATTIMLYVARITDCGVDLLGVADVAQHPGRLPTLLSQFIGARLLVSLVACVLLIGAGLLLMPQPEGAVLAVYALTLLPIAIAVRWAHLGLEQSPVVSLARITTEVLSAVLTVALVRNPGDVMLAPLALLIGEAVGAFILIRALPTHRVSPRALLRFDVVANLFRRSWSVVLYALLGLLIFNSDFFFLRVFRGTATVGFYAAAYALVSFVTNVGNVYSLSLLPIISRLRADRDGERMLYHTAIAQLLGGALPLVVGGCLVADRLIPLVFDATYAPAVLPLRILLWSIPLSLMRGVAQSVLVARDRQALLLRTVAWAAAINVVLNLALIPRWGMVGAAVATTCTNVARVSFMFAFIREEGIPMISLARFWKTSVACAVMVVALLLLRSPSAWLDVGVGAFVYVAALVLVGGIRLRRDALPELSL